MRLERYELIAEASLMIFEFVSEGPKGVNLLNMKMKRLNKSKSPAVRIDNSLERYRSKVISKDKLDKANDMLKTTGLPKPGKHN